MNWLLYLVTSIIISHLICKFILINRYISYIKIFPILLVLFMTPARIAFDGSELGPSVFTFIFNVILEKDYSTRPLRPLIISMPVTIFVVFFADLVKKRFFR